MMVNNRHVYEKALVDCPHLPRESLRGCLTLINNYLTQLLIPMWNAFCYNGKSRVQVTLSSYSSLFRGPLTRPDSLSALYLIYICSGLRCLDIALEHHILLTNLKTARLGELHKQGKYRVRSLVSCLSSCCPCSLCFRGCCCWIYISFINWSNYWINLILDIALHNRERLRCNDYEIELKV